MDTIYEEYKFKPKNFTGHTLDDYRVIILSFKESLKNREMTIREIAQAYGLYQPTLAKVFTLMKKEGIFGKRKKHSFRSNKAIEIENFLIKYRGFLNMSKAAEQFGCSREYIRQVKKRLVVSGRIKEGRRIWD